MREVNTTNCTRRVSNQGRESQLKATSCDNEEGASSFSLRTVRPVYLQIALTSALRESCDVFGPIAAVLPPPC